MKKDFTQNTTVDGKDFEKAILRDITGDLVWKAAFHCQGIDSTVHENYWHPAMYHNMLWRNIWPAILTLIAHDDCGYMLETDSPEIEILARLGDSKAVPLTIVCKVFLEIKNYETRYSK